MLKKIRSIQSYVSNKVHTEYSPIQKLVLVPFTVLALGDFACLGKILGATICYFEGYSNDDYICNTVIKNNKDGSYCAKSSFTFVSHTASKCSDVVESMKNETVPPFAELTITNIIYSPISAPKNNFRNTIQKSLLKGEYSFELEFYKPLTKCQAHELVQIYHETGMSISTRASLKFLENLKHVDSRLAEEWEREILLEMDIDPMILKPWKDHDMFRSSSGEKNRDISRCSRLDKKKKRNNFS